MGKGSAGYQGRLISAAIHECRRQRSRNYGERGTIRDTSRHRRGIRNYGRVENGKAGNAYNVGTGEGRSNIDVIKMIEPLASAAGLTIQLRFMPPRKFDVAANVLDSGRLGSISGWRPLLKLDDGIRRLWQSVALGSI